MCPATHRSLVMLHTCTNITFRSRVQERPAAVVGGERIRVTVTDFPSSPSSSAGCEYVHTSRTSTDPLDVHMGPTRDQMLLLCRLCRLSHILMNHYPNTSPPLLLNNQTYGLCCLATVPTTNVSPGPQFIKVPEDETARAPDLPLI